MNYIKLIFRKCGFPILFLLVILGVTIGFDWLKYNNPILLIAFCKIYIALTAGVFLGYIKGHWFD